MASFFFLLGLKVTYSWPCRNIYLFMTVLETVSLKRDIFPFWILSIILGIMTMSFWSTLFFYMFKWVTLWTTFSSNWVLIWLLIKKRFCYIFGHFRQHDTVMKNEALPYFHIYLMPFWHYSILYYGPPVKVEERMMHLPVFLKSSSFNASGCLIHSHVT